MKKIFLFLLSALCFQLSAFSQNTDLIVSNDTTVNADTAYVTVRMKSHLKGIQVTVNKVSGTVAGAVYLQGTIDGSNWLQIGADSLTLSDKAVNTAIFSFTSTQYVSYRAMLKTTGTQSSYLTVAVLRRNDE